MTPVQEDLDPEAWVVLGSIHRHANGGPRPPDEASAAFADAYSKLHGAALIERSSDGPAWVITDKGERVLRARFGID